MEPIDVGPWFEFAPRSEQEVVTLFGLLLPRLKRRFLINEVREQFPDCQAWEINGSAERKLVRIEFELRATNFAAHKHPAAAFTEVRNRRLGSSGDPVAFAR